MKRILSLILAAIMLLSVIAVSASAAGSNAYGELSGDGKVTATDALIVLQHVVGKTAIAEKLIQKAADYQIAPERIFIDPLVLSLSAVNNSMISFMDTVRSIKKIYPTVHTVSGLSNISYGMPYRKIVNMNFLALALSAGMDTAILDPENRDMIATVYAVEALLGQDRYCRKYNKAFRQGVFGPARDTGK